VAAFIVEKDIMKVVLYTGLCWLILPVFFLPSNIIRLKFSIKRYASVIRELTVFSIPRVPGDLAFALLFALPPLIASHATDLENAGNIAFSITLLNMTTAAFAPISVILLPEARKLILDKSFSQLNKRIDSILKLTLLTTIVGVVIFEFSAEILLKLYLGTASESLIKVSKWILPGSVGLAVFISLRSILDAYYQTARNSRNILISFSVFILFAVGILITNASSFLILPSLVISLSLLGILTYLNLKDIKLLAKVNTQPGKNIVQSQKL